MPSKKGSQSKEQQQTQQQSQQQPIPTSSTAMTTPTTVTAAMAANKVEASQQQLVQLLQENSDPVTVVMSVVDKKVRNLDKRKTRLVTLKQKMDAGEKIDRDQMDAVSKLQSVEEQLEMLKDIQKQLNGLGTEYNKIKKKQQRQEKAQQREQQREIERTAISGALRLQLVLNSLDENAKEDFQNGANGAVRLSKTELEQLDDWYQLINPSRTDSEDYSQVIQEATGHILLYLEKSSKQVIGTTYEELHKLVCKVDESGYFDEAHVGSEEDEDYSQEEEEEEEVKEECEDGDESSPEEDDTEPQTTLQQMAQQTAAINLEGQSSESPQSTASVPTHLPAAVQPQLTNQGIVSSHMNYLPGTPSPTFPGLQPSILQSGGEENFQIDFLHDSDVRVAEHKQANGASSYITHQQQQPQQSHELSSTDYDYSTSQLTMSTVDSTVPPIVSPTGEMIQPGPLSYKQSTSGTGQHVTSHTPELNEQSTTSALGSSGQPLQPNSKHFPDDYHQSSGQVFPRKSSNNGGSSASRSYDNNNNNTNYRMGNRGGKSSSTGYRSSGQMVGPPVIDRGSGKPPYQVDYRRNNNNSNTYSKGRGGQRGGGTASRKT